MAILGDSKINSYIMVNLITANKTNVVFVQKGVLGISYTSASIERVLKDYALPSGFMSASPVLWDFQNLCFYHWMAGNINKFPF
jgi:hypothetical protein